MGYESKLVVVKKWSCDSGDSFGETIAEINLCGMPDSFFPISETFENELKGKQYIYLDGETATEDKYGELLRFTTVRKLLNVLYKCEAEGHYRRTEIAINLLKSFTSDDWDNIVVFHYGY